MTKFDLNLMSWENRVQRPSSRYFFGASMGTYISSEVSEARSIAVAPPTSTYWK